MRGDTTLLLAALVNGLAAQQGLAGQQFVRAGRAQVQQVDDGFTTASFADLDADGDLDFIGAPLQSTEPVQVYENVGAGRFRVDPRFTPFSTTLLPTGLLVGDIDGDGRTDVLTRTWVVRNRGALGPLAVQHGISGLPLTLGDFNGDGRADVVAFDSGNQVSIWLASATFTFSPIILGVAPAQPTGAAAGDLDGDGAQDLVIATYGVELALRNTGGGQMVYMQSWIPASVPDRTDAIRLADFDRDGDLDLATHDGLRWVFRDNDGTGRLISSPRVIPEPFDFGTLPHRLIDLDRDGAVDFVETAHWWHNGTPAGTFDRRLLPATPMGAFCDAADVDGDGDLDLLVAGNDGNGFGYRLLLDVGGQSYVDATAFPWTPDGVLGQAGRNATAAADLDRDGDVDLICAGGSLHRNRGDGWFDAAPLTWTSTPSNSRVCLGDIDGDGDQDVFAITLMPPGIRTLLNFGGGTLFDFSAIVPFPPMAPGYVTDAIAFDVDGNHTVDLVYATSSGEIRLVRNDGALGFTNDPSAFPVLSELPSSLAVADFDRDGDADLVAGASSGPATRVGLHMFVNDGSGRFADSRARLSLPTPLQVVSVQAFDADGDGDQDLAVGITGLHHRLMLNNGTGVLFDGGVIPTLAPNGRVVAADVDGDGDQDLVAGCVDGLRLWLNDGSARFTDVGIISPLWNQVPLFADIDGDGDPDLVLGGQIFRNRTWDASAPFMPLTGRAYALEFGGTAIPTGIAMPWVSTARARVPLPPFGTLGIDHQSAIELPWLLIAGGTARYEVVLPNNGSMLGVDLAIQAVLYDGVLPHLSPPIYETISH